MLKIYFKNMYNYKAVVYVIAEVLLLSNFSKKSVMENGPQMQISAFELKCIRHTVLYYFKKRLEEH